MQGKRSSLMTIATLPDLLIKFVQIQTNESVCNSISNSLTPFVFQGLGTVFHAARFPLALIFIICFTDRKHQIWYILSNCNVLQCLSPGLETGFTGLETAVN